MSKPTIKSGLPCGFPDSLLQGVNLEEVCYRIFNEATVVGPSMEGVELCYDRGTLFSMEYAQEDGGSVEFSHNGMQYLVYTSRVLQ